MGVLDAEGAELRDAEDEAGDDEAPGAAGAEDLDEEVGSDAWGEGVSSMRFAGGMEGRKLTAQKSAAKTAHGQDGDMHLLPLDEEGLVHRVVIALPERIDIVANVASRWIRSVMSLKMIAGEKAYLMVIKPMPARIPMMQNSCQKSTLRSRRQPRISIRWERSRLTLLWT